MSNTINVFLRYDIAGNYDSYYNTEFGKKVDEIEKKIVSGLIKNIPRTKMIELGCGTGHWTKFFSDTGFDVTGIDNSHHMLAHAVNKKINAEFISGDAENLTFLNESIDVVASITMLEFVDNKDVVFKEINRILKPGGWLILGCLNSFSVVGQNKSNDETFRNASFLNEEVLEEKLKMFGDPVIKPGVFLNNNFEILDDIPGKEKYDPVFLGAVVQKIK